MAAVRARAREGRRGRGDAPGSEGRAGDESRREAVIGEETLFPRPSDARAIVCTANGVLPILSSMTEVVGGSSAERDGL